MRELVVTCSKRLGVRCRIDKRWSLGNVQAVNVSSRQYVAIFKKHCIVKYSARNILSLTVEWCYRYMGTYMHESTENLQRHAIHVVYAGQLFLNPLKAHRHQRSLALRITIGGVV